MSERVRRSYVETFRAGILMVSIAVSLLLLVPAGVQAQPEQGTSTSPPVAQQLVREGDLAIRLAAALGLGTIEDETEAESRLGEAGIAPRNGWIADYPVTPDIIAELYVAVGNAADGGRISFEKEDALRRFEEVTAQSNLPVKPHSEAKRYEAVPPEEAEKYPNPTVINNYYYNEGPPVVTYYAPPPDYYYLYSWVPSPFWSFGFWFPGFFILNDFHTTVYVGYNVRFVSNHFRDIGAQRVYRIDPVTRYRGRTYAGIGVSSRRGFISTGTPQSDRRIFNAPRTRTAPGGSVVSTPSRGGKSAAPSPRGGSTVSPAPRTGGTMSPAPRTGGTISPAPRGGGMVSPPSRGGTAGPSMRGGGGTSGRGR